jgi:serine/threonine-protein kinase
VEPGKSVPLRAAEIREQLDRILSSFATSGANRRSRLLRYLVEETLEDRPESLKESVIATAVFDRDPGYDPQIDSVVRVEVGRLRARLAEYYEKVGVDAPVRIEIPRGSYRPVFVFREAAPEIVTPVEPPARKWKWVTAGLVAAAALTIFVVWRIRTLGPVTPAAIAVLPFLNLSGDASDEYLADGISEDLTETLAEFNDLRVVARTSAFQYKGKSIDVGEIGRNLRAGAVLEGSIAKRGGQLRVIAQLVRTSDGYHLWSHSYDATLAELPPVEAAIAQAAREKLAPSSARTGPTELAAARNPEAHDLYMRAVYEFNQRTEASTRQAMELARQATEKDPSFAQPFVVMAAGESQLIQLQEESPHAGAERAREYIAKALALDPANSGAHAQKALLAYADQWDWPQAEREFKLALAAGSHGSAENLYGWCLITRGRFEEARRRLQMAAELDPLSLGPQLNQIEELLAERNYPEAKRRVDQILRNAPSNWAALSLATSIGFWQSDCAGTKTASDKLMELYPKAPGARLGGIAAQYVCGHPEEARAAATEMFQHPSGYLSPYSIAGSIALGGNADAAMPYLQQSAELREPRLMMLKYDRVFDLIRQDARFIALERRLGLID